jgi:hypothetical protein
MSARTSKDTAAQSEPSLLPISEIALAHHLNSLSLSMEEWSKTKRLPPVLLLTGLSGIGKRTIAYFLSQWIFCEKTGFVTSPDASMESSLFGGSPAPTAQAEALLRPCGDCIQCKRAINGTWVAFTEITSDDEEEGSTGSLKIDQFRKLKESAGYSADEGSYKIILIANADRMTLQAANSMLKILEEPPRGWIFLLTASDPTLILPTVLSRCQAMKLKPMPVETIRALLSDAGVLGEKQKVSALLSEGSWGRAISLATDDVLEHRQILFDFLERPQGGLNPLVDWAAQTSENLGLLFDQLEMICLDLIRYSLSNPSAEPAGDRTWSWTNVDGSRALQNHAQALTAQRGSLEASRRFWIARSERIAQARREALLPLNKKLLIQDVLLPWLEASN